jgi:dUTPase
VGGSTNERMRFMKKKWLKKVYDFYLVFFVAGVIDEDYRGPVGVILFNHADVDFEVNEGDRVAQLICEKIMYPEIVEAKVKKTSDMR